MKIVKIFGLVVALHVVPLTIFLLSQGCQSSLRKAPEQPAPSDVQPVEPVSGNWSSQGETPPGRVASESTLTPMPVGAPLTGLTPAERARTSPIRPDNPEAYISTTAQPSALAPAAPAGASTYTVMAGDSLWKIAKKHGTTVAELAKANPTLKGDALKPGIVLQLPAGVAGTQPAAAPAGGTQMLTMPSFSPGGSVTSAAATSTYVVRAGDSLARIAARNGTTVAALRQANNLRSDTIQIGQSLVIPSTGPAGAVAAAPAGAAPATTAVASAPAAARGITVTVQPGETLSVIARRYHVTVQDIMTANQIGDARKVRAGQSLRIPGYEPVGGGVVPPAPAPVRAPSTTTRPGVSAPPAQQPVEAPAEGPATQPAPDLDTMLPPGAVDAPVVPVDEPVPQP
jgi:LysM repeat protein